VRQLSTRTVVAVGLVVTLLLAGGLSVYASTRPDGLQRVAHDHGFADSQRQSATAESPLAGYGAGSGDRRLAGVLGAVVVLALVSGTTYVLRRRARDAVGS